MLVMLEERVRNGYSVVFHPFSSYIWLLWMNQICICLLQLKQHGCWWNNSALGNRRKSWDKAPQETSALSCPKPNVQPTNLRGECLHPPVTLCPLHDPPTRILDILQWRKSSAAIGIITFARLHRARKLLLLSRSLQHQAISASGDVRRWSPC